MATLKEIDTLTRKHADARTRLADHVRALTGDIEAAKRSYLPGIRGAVARAKDTEAELRAAIEASPELFVKPRTQTLHGIRVGFKKGKGKLEIDNEEHLVKLIRKHFPEQFDALVKTTEKPLKGALEQLAAADLKKLGIEVADTGDVVFIKDTASDVDKLVDALLAETEEASQ